MNFVNNYIQPITLTQAATTAQLSLPDGEYRLTVTDAQRTQHEIVGAVVAGGTATLTRGLEGTAAQLWPSGSEIYCALTAATLVDFDQRITAAGGSGGGASAQAFLEIGPITAQLDVSVSFARLFDSSGGARTMNLPALAVGYHYRLTLHAKVITGSSMRFVFAPADAGATGAIQTISEASSSFDGGDLVVTFSADWRGTLILDVYCPPGEVFEYSFIGRWQPMPAFQSLPSSGPPTF